MLKPPICRMGGKSKLRKTIIEMIPEHTCYVELFFGAGWVYFGKEEHLLLRDKLKNLKGKFLLTINDDPEVREWYKDLNIKEVQVNYSVSKQTEARKKYAELIITNY